MVQKKTGRTKGSIVTGADEESSRLRSEGIKELFVIRDGELPMKTETPPRKVDPFVMMEVVEYAISLPKKNGKRRLLSQVYREAHDIRMISKSRKGRIEIEKILASQGKELPDEMAI